MCNQDTCVYFHWPPSVVIGNSRLQWFWQNSWKLLCFVWFWIGKRHIWQFQKRHFTSFCCVSFFFWFLCQKKLENGPSETKFFSLENRSYWVLKNRELYAYFIMQTYFRDKISLKQVKSKKTKKIRLGIRKQIFYFNFLGSILSLRDVFSYQHKICDFLIPYLYDPFQKIQISTVRRSIFQIFRHKNRNKTETPQNKKMPFLK